MAMTERQRQALDKYRELGAIRKVAAELGIAPSATQRLIARAEKWEDLDAGISDALEETGLSDVAKVRGGWLKTKGASIRFDMPRENDAENIVEAIKAGIADMPPPPTVRAPQAPKELCAVFPVADLHMGLLACEEEVGVDWDTKEARRVFQDTFGKLVSITPAAGVAVIAQLGDLTHNDDQRNVTPQSGHQLDVDSRYFLILRRSVAAMKWAIEELRRKYPAVIYRGCRGNHDLTAHHAVTLALAEHYSDVDGVEIVTSAREFHVMEFHKNMLLLHHGDRAKPERLVTFAAAEWPEIWGRTKHRLALSGHVHHETRKEIGGMAFESVGTIIPRDVHAYSNAYSAKRYLASICLDAQDGEISRARVNV